MKMRKILWILCIAAICMGIVSGCSEEQETTETTSSDISSEDVSGLEVQDEEEQKVETVIKRAIPIVSESRFQEGLVWVYGEQYKYECIDKDGNVVIWLNGVYPLTGFQNGYAHINNNGSRDSDTNTQCAVINTEGEILSRYSADQEAGKEIVAFGAGYTVVQTHTENFDENSYEYTIFDPNGESAGSITSEARLPVEYCGEGVFEFQNESKRMSDDYRAPKYFFCTSTNKVVDLTAEDYFYFDKKVDVFFYDDTALIGRGTDLATDKSGVLLLDSSGNLRKISYSEIVSTTSVSLDEDSYVSEGYLIFEGDDDLYHLYNIDTGEMTDLDEKYAGKGYLSDSPILSNGLGAIELIGEDENHYVALFNTSGEIIMDPIQCLKSGSYVFADGKLVIQTDYTTLTIVDETGSVTLEKKSDTNAFNFEFSDYNGFGEDVWCFEDGDTSAIQFLDKEGNQLFDTVNFTDDTVEIEESAIS